MKMGLGEREVFGPSKLGKGAWPDGIAFDSFGNIWGTCVYSDKLFVLTPTGDMITLLDEGDSAKVEALERQFLAGAVTEDVLFATGRGIAPWMASVTFGGQICRPSTLARSEDKGCLISARLRRAADGALERTLLTVPAIPNKNK